MGDIQPIHLFNALLSILMAGVGWWVNNIWRMMQSQQEQITALNVKLAENYAPRSESDKVYERIFDKLDELQRDIRLARPK